MHFISGIQQAGIGVRDVCAAFNWYNDALGFDVRISDNPGTAELMLRYTGGEPQQRRAVLAVNLQGGGGIEIWQYMSRPPIKAGFEVKLGDLGIYILKIRTENIYAAHSSLMAKGAEILGPVFRDKAGVECFYFRDPYGNLLQMVQTKGVFQETEAANGGVYGAVIGVSDIEKSMRFYSKVLGYDQAVYDETGQFDDFRALPGGDREFRRVLLAHSQPRRGPFSRLMGESRIELVSAIHAKPNKIYRGRYWGDLGYIHICFGVQGMKSLKELCDREGYPFTVDSDPGSYEQGAGTHDMGGDSGHFTYTEDPDGTLIGFVETHRLPILKKIGWYKNLKKMEPGKALPDWMLKALRFTRVRVQRP
jgi:catechol 2,3-dioxygenase-like lactoylglutathione lyase family enzyme